MPSRAGSPNKNKQRLLNALKKEYGEDFDPVMQMAKNANEIQKLVEDPDYSKADVSRIDAINAWDKIAQYTTPKLKAVEISGAIETHELTHEEWLDSLKEIEEND